MELTPKEEFNALVTLTAALISRSHSLPAHSQLVDEAWHWLNAIVNRVEGEHKDEP
jgi:hypothetical protein